MHNRTHGRHWMVKETNKTTNFRARFFFEGELTWKITWPFY